MVVIQLIVFGTTLMIGAGIFAAYEIADRVIDKKEGIHDRTLL